MESIPNKNNPRNPWTKYLNDKNRLWPKGVELIPGSVNFFNKAFTGLETFIKDEAGEEFSMDNLPDFEDVFSKIGENKKGKFFLLALAVISATPENAQAQNKFTNQIEINWLFEGLEKISPLQIAEWHKEPLAIRDERRQLSEEEKNILAWNIYHEARSVEEGEAGQLGVLLTTLNRLQNKNYPATVHGVVFQKDQFSWTRDVLAGKHQKRNEDFVTYSKIRKLVNDYTNNGTLTDNINAIRGRIKTLLNLKHDVPEGITHYQKENMLNIDSYSREASFSTKKRIIVTQHLLNNPGIVPNVLRLGTQIFYPYEFSTANFIDKKIKEFNLQVPEK